MGISFSLFTSSSSSSLGHGRNGNNNVGSIFIPPSSTNPLDIIDPSTSSSHWLDVEHDEDADGDIVGLRQQFHNTVRENIIFMLFFLVLCMISWTVIGIFTRKKDKEDGSSRTSSSSSSLSSQNHHHHNQGHSHRQPVAAADDEESLVYRICFWLCVFSLSISMGATLLLPISIVSNEVLLLYPQTYYVQWLNAMLIQGLWNLIFLFANISLFVLLPFAHLFIESEGFSGNRRGLTGRLKEAVAVLVLSFFAIWGISHILAALLSPTTKGASVFSGLFNIIGFSNQLPFIYSCISFFGVVLLLLCTPLGTGSLFTVLSQLLVGPQFLRNLEEEYRLKFLESESLKNKLKAKLDDERRVKEYLSSEKNRKDDKRLKKAFSVVKQNNLNSDIDTRRGHHHQNGLVNGQENDILHLRAKWDQNIPSSSGKEDDEAEESSFDVVDDAGCGLNRRGRDKVNPELINKIQKMMSLNNSIEKEALIDESEESIRGRLRIMEEELEVLERLKKTPGWKRNLLYPIAFLVVLLLTGLTVLMVVINTLQLMVGMKELPFMNAEDFSFSLGLSSTSILGTWGAGLQVILILYLMTTSAIGLYSLPGVRSIKPRRGDSPTSHIIYNCALVLILSSALPVLSRILGITDFDLLGNYGKIEWLGNFYIVFLYNIIFTVACTLCLVNKFTSPIRQELTSRFKAVIRFLKGFPTSLIPSYFQSPQPTLHRRPTVAPTTTSGLEMMRGRSPIPVPPPVLQRPYFLNNSPSSCFSPSETPVKAPFTLTKTNKINDKSIANHEREDKEKEKTL